MKVTESLGALWRSGQGRGGFSGTVPRFDRESSSVASLGTLLKAVELCSFVVKTCKADAGILLQRPSLMLGSVPLRTRVHTNDADTFKIPDTSFTVRNRVSVTLFIVFTLIILFLVLTSTTFVFFKYIFINNIQSICSL